MMQIYSHLPSDERIAHADRIAFLSEGDQKEESSNLTRNVDFRDKLFARLTNTRGSQNSLFYIGKEGARQSLKSCSQPVFLEFHLSPLQAAQSRQTLELETNDKEAAERHSKEESLTLFAAT